MIAKRCAKYWSSVSSDYPVRARAANIYFWLSAQAFEQGVNDF